MTKGEAAVAAILDPYARGWSAPNAAGLQRANSGVDACPTRSRKLLSVPSQPIGYLPVRLGGLGGRGGAPIRSAAGVSIRGRGGGEGVSAGSDGTDDENDVSSDIELELPKLDALLLLSG